MAKIIKIENNTKYYLKKVDSLIEQEDFTTALIESNNAMRVAKNKKEKKDSYIYTARLLNLKFRFEYSNELLFKALMLYPHDQEIKMMIMMNLLSLQDFDAARHYYNQVKKYVQKRREENKAMILDALRENGFFEEDVEEIVKPFNINIEKILEGEKAEGHFTLHDHTERFNRVFNTAVELLKEKDYEGSIKNLDEALSFKVRKQKKALAYYSKALCLYNLQRFEEAKEIALKGLEVESNNINLRLIYCEIINELGDKKELLEKLKEWFLNIQKDDYQFIRRIVVLYMQNEFWDEAIVFLNKRSDFLLDSYEVNEYLGICYFNKGDSKKAKAIFTRMNDLYGDVCNAKHFLYYFSLKRKDGIPVDAVFGDWPELNREYLNYLYNLFITDDDNEFATTLLTDSDKIILMLRWFSQGIRSNFVYELLDRIMAIGSLSPRVNNKLNDIKMKIMELICLPGYFDGILKCQIVFSFFKYQVFDKVSICNNNILYTVKVSIDTLENNYHLLEGCYLACAIALNYGEEEYYKTENAVNMIIDLAKRKDIPWKHVGSIAAMIIDYALDVTVNGQETGVKYNYSLKKKYRTELSEFLSE